MNPLLNKDLFIIICNLLENKDFFKLELLSKFHYDIINSQEIIWDKRSNYRKLRFNLTTYYEIPNNTKQEDINKLIRPKVLNLNDSKLIPNKNFIHLEEIWINENISDDMISEFKQLKKIIFPYFYYSNFDVKKFKNITIVDYPHFDLNIPKLFIEYNLRFIFIDY